MLHSVRLTEGNKSRREVRELTACALFIALITVGTFIRIPLGTDFFTLQFLFTLLTGLLLGARLGVMTVGTYVLMGLLGIPVFAAGGGLGYVAQPTFGYLLGFVIQAWFCGYFSRRLREVTTRRVLAVNVGGMVIVYFIGITWFYYVSNYVNSTPIDLWTTILVCGLLQILPDLALCTAAAYLAVRCYKAGLWF